MCHVRRAHRQFRSDCIIALLDSRSGDIDQAMKIEPIDFYYLSTPQGLDIGALWNGELGLGACGDWLIGPRVECAWLSGRELARQMAGSAAQAD